MRGAGTLLLAGLRSQGRSRVKQAAGRPGAKDDAALRLAIGILILFPRRSRFWAAERAALLAYGLPFGTPFGPIRTEPSDTVEHNINALCQRLARKLQVVAKLDPENRRAAAEGNAGLQAQRAQVATGEGFRAALRQEVERLAEDVATAHAGRGARRG